MNGDAMQFEEPILQIRRQMEDLRQANREGEFDRQIDELGKKLSRMSREVYAKLTPWQKTLVARHPLRPYTLDFISMLFEEFAEVHGDRKFGDDSAIVAGFARFDGRSCAVIGHQKGRDTKEKIARNFGMPRPEGYRKALRVMKLAEKFNRPVVTLIDTPGAYPGVGAEERDGGAAGADRHRRPR